MSEISFNITGSKEMLGVFGLIDKQEMADAAGAMYGIANLTMREIKKIAPIETGAMAASGIVEKPVKTQDNVVVKMGVGGPSAPYALVQHENLSFKHKPGRSAKFVEIPVTKSGESFASDMAYQLRVRRANRGIRGPR